MYGNLQRKRGMRERNGAMEESLTRGFLPLEIISWKKIFVKQLKLLSLLGKESGKAN